MTERIMLTIPLETFINIGITSAVALQNSENQWLEYVFAFYQRLAPLNSIADDSISEQ